MVQITNAILTTAAALAAVLALVLLAGRVLRHTSLGRAAKLRYGVVGSSRLVLQDTLALDRVRRLHLVRCDGKDLLLLTSDSGDTLVGWHSVQSQAS